MDRAARQKIKGSFQKLSTKFTKKEDADVPYLRQLIIAAAALHLAQFVASAAILFPRRVSFPVVKNYAKWNVNRTVVGPNGTLAPAVEHLSEPFGTLNLAALISCFFLLSALFQGLPAIFWWKSFLKGLHEGIQPWRWFEYAFSSSCIVLVAAALSGVDDFHFLLMLFAANAVVMLLGYVQEQRMYMWRSLPTSETLLSQSPIALGFPHLVGWIPYSVFWAIIFDKLILAEKHNKQIPALVKAFYGIVFVLFCSFVAVQLWQMRRMRSRTVSPDEVEKVSRWCELWYTILSFTSKTVIAWFYVGGVYQYTKL